MIPQDGQANQWDRPQCYDGSRRSALLGVLVDFDFAGHNAGRAGRALDTDMLPGSVRCEELLGSQCRVVHLVSGAIRGRHGLTIHRERVRRAMKSAMEPSTSTGPLVSPPAGAVPMISIVVA